MGLSSSLCLSLGLLLSLGLRLGNFPSLLSIVSVSVVFGLLLFIACHLVHRYPLADELLMLASQTDPSLKDWVRLAFLKFF